MATAANWRHIAAPRLEAGKHDVCDWVGPENLELLMAGRTDGDRRLRGLVARAVRTRLTPRLRLSPLGPWHAGDLWGRGYATEIGAAGLAFAFDDLGTAEVVAFTERVNRRSRAVMERLGMRYAGDITHGGAPFVLYATDRDSWRP